MKSNYVKVSLALLSAVFILGCQDLAPVGPDGLVPQFGKVKNCDPPDPHPSCEGDDSGSGGDNPGSPFYAYTFTNGPLTMDLEPAGARPTVGNSQQGGWVVLRAHFDPEIEKLKLSGDLVDLLDARQCFGGMVDDDVEVVFLQFSGDLRPTKKNKNNVKARFLFGSVNSFGDSIVYLLDLEGDGLRGDGENATGDKEGDLFPPEVDQTMTVAFDHAFLFAQSNGEKNACTGDGDVVSSVIITGLDKALPIPN